MSILERGAAFRQVAPFCMDSCRAPLDALPRAAAPRWLHWGAWLTLILSAALAAGVAFWPVETPVPAAGIVCRDDAPSGGQCQLALQATDRAPNPIKPGQLVHFWKTEQPGQIFRATVAAINPHPADDAAAPEPAVQSNRPPTSEIQSHTSATIRVLALTEVPAQSLADGQPVQALIVTSRRPFWLHLISSQARAQTERAPSPRH